MTNGNDEGLSGVTVGVVGAGMMGSALAYTCSRAGADVVVVARSGAGAGRAVDYARRREARARGTGTGAGPQEPRGALLSRIHPTTSMSALSDADLVVEAVAESTEVKHSVLRSVERATRPDAILSSTTSTLPVSGLAEVLEAPDRFLGMHFFSPVDRMPLVEIVIGERTAPATVESAQDLARRMGQQPILVRDGRGFFTSRVMEKRIDEALIALGEGVDPHVIENASTQAGYPVPTLQLLDEISIALNREVQAEHRAHVEASGATWTGAAADRVRDSLVVDHRRTGRATGGGFYDYDDDGRRTGLWKGLEREFGPYIELPAVDIRDRLVFSEVLEALRCVGLGIVVGPDDADTGSLLGIGFPRHTGGVISYARDYPGGADAFLGRATELAHLYGDRFLPDRDIRDAMNRLSSRT